MICPLLSKSAAEPAECLKEQCAWFLKPRNKYDEAKCAIVKIAEYMPVI